MPLLRRLALLSLILVTTAIAVEAEVAPAPDARLAPLRALSEADAAGLRGLRAGTAVLPVAAIDNDAVRFTAPIGEIAVRTAHLRGTRGEPAEGRRLGDIIARATTAGLNAESAPLWRLEPSATLGWHLRSADLSILVIPEAVMRRQELPNRQRSTDIEALSTAAAAVSAALGRTPGVEPLTARATADVLQRLLRPDSDPAIDEVTPGFARRVLSAGFMQRVAPQLDAGLRAGLERSLAAARALHPRLAFKGDGHELLQVADAWGDQGDGGWVYRSPAATLIAVRPARPMIDSHRWSLLSQMVVAIDLPAGSDPLSNPQVIAQARSARLVHDGEVLAEWDGQADRLRADRGRWRRVFPGGSSNDGSVRDIFPPHLPVLGLDGALHGLAVAGGLLRPAADARDEEAERFIADAARLLPDAAHLDLITQYFFKYVYDSPDPTQPLGMGNKEIKGDIHQTTLQTLDTVVAGVARGDCDDLAELAFDLVTRQGKLPHVISLPGHAACAWAERSNDRWQVFVLQTGPTLQFTHAELPKALEAAYKHFDAADNFDPNGLGLLLRFSGENTRSAWRLSWRIFAERDYAETMIDVQKDWHYQTYLQGIQKMLRMIEQGDHDNANYRELSGLYTFTGQYAKSVEFHRGAIERTEEPESRLFMHVELVHHLLQAKMVDEAKALVEDILSVQLPAMAERLGPGVAQIGAQLAGMIVGEHEPVLAASVLARTAEPIVEIGRQLVAILGRGLPQATWDNHPQLRSMRRLIQGYAYTALAIREQLTPEQRESPEAAQVISVLRSWIERLAFADSEDIDDLLARYALLGRWYGDGNHAEFLTELAAAELPVTTAGVDHRGLAQRQDRAAQLPFIRLSPFVYNDILARLIDNKKQRPDPALLRQIAPLLDASVAALDRLDIASRQIDNQVHYARVALALLTKDEAGLRSLLRRVKQLDDKRLRDDTAQMMGDAAIHLDAAWWRTVVSCWVEELDYKPKYYWVAWRAALAGAHAHALHMADVAAKRFADDSDFVHEARFMHELFGR